MKLDPAIKQSLQYRLFRREFDPGIRSASIRDIYGSRELIENMDIVNELSGHRGCVNALSWSRSGALLASGSDDTFLNVYRYQPENSTAPFILNTSVSTGHTANIFSVKFMPHSNDTTLVTCAGDTDVRVFDIEYSGQTREPSGPSAIQRMRNSAVFAGANNLTDGDTNCRVYKCHSNRVKRIVTESSPYLFLTCSEDGDVRQWDLRLPSSAYPSTSPLTSYSHTSSSSPSPPPPLISYRYYGLDLNTISCSPAQPWYIALGGEHLHCFLHDRRMLGRDVLAERGISGSASSASRDNNTMNKATRCVRKFAPDGRARENNRRHGHITSCKISDANPNEMVVSWSGDHIYSFDLIRSPDAEEHVTNDTPTISTKPTRQNTQQSSDRKRKREHTTSGDFSHRRSTRAGPRPRTDAAGESASSASGHAPQFGEDDAEQHPDLMQPARVAILPDAQVLGRHIADGLLRIRHAIFSLERGVWPQNSPSSLLANAAASFTRVIRMALALIPEIDNVNRYWHYPMFASDEEIAIQKALRLRRESYRRFVQAAGSIAQYLNRGQSTEGSFADDPELYFQQIVPTPCEGRNIEPEDHFRYDFIKAILLWLRGGRLALLAGFKRPANQRNDSPRFPLARDVGISAVNDLLLPYLLQLATDKPVVDVDGPHLPNGRRPIIINTERSAVITFNSIVSVPFPEEDAYSEDNYGTVADAFNDPENTGAPDSPETRVYWAIQIARGILMNASEDFNYEVIKTAFCGPESETDESEMLLEQPHDAASQSVVRDERTPRGHALPNLVQEPAVPEASHDAHHWARSQGEDTDDDDDNDDEDEDDEDEDDGEFSSLLSFVRSPHNKGPIEPDVPVYGHSRVYKGHCNVQTVKDVNFFGLRDEYVVSGSDDGNVFIWDKKTTKLVSILEADSEVANVVQGHPYEPMLAVSGIDNTIKIFSPDNRAQADAFKGINVMRCRSGRRARPPRLPVVGPQNILRAAHFDEDDDSDNSTTTSAEQPPNVGLTSRKRMDKAASIISHNNITRRAGNNESFITRAMFTQLAATIERDQLLVDPDFSDVHNDDASSDTGDYTILVSEQCELM